MSNMTITQGAKMKIRVSLTVNVDPKAWEETYGDVACDVREAVRIYVETLVNNSAASDECDLEAVLL